MLTSREVGVREVLAAPSGVGLDARRRIFGQGGGHAFRACRIMGDEIVTNRMAAMGLAIVAPTAFVSGGRTTGCFNGLVRCGRQSR